MLNAFPQKKTVQSNTGQSEHGCTLTAMDWTGKHAQSFSFFLPANDHVDDFVTFGGHKKF